MFETKQLYSLHSTDPHPSPLPTQHIETLPLSSPQKEADPPSINRYPSLFLPQQSSSTNLPTHQPHFTISKLFTSLFFCPRVLGQNSGTEKWGGVGSRGKSKGTCAQDPSLGCSPEKMMAMPANSCLVLQAPGMVLYEGGWVPLWLPRAEPQFL